MNVVKMNNVEIQKKISFTDFLSKYGLIVGFIILFVVMAFLSPVFLTKVNLINILRQVAVNGIISVGMTFAIISAGIDLSVGAVLAFSGLIMVMTQGQGAVVALLAALLSGVLWGFVNGMFITKGKVQPFVVTMASMTLVQGVTLMVSGGHPITLKNPTLLRLGSDYLGPIPILVVVFAIVIILGWVLLSKTSFGRYTYAIGTSESASKLAGIKIDRIKILIYTLCGAMAALAGVILTSRLSSASPIAGAGYELDAIAAVAIGGASLAGGEGKMVGTLFGVLIVGVITNGLVLLDVNVYIQQIIKGIIILVAVLIGNRK
ncbi:ribose ABC transporter permease [Paenibacillus sp. BSR1-1]|uniref:ABC transporter permease n=1 Tax=Paenibacillus sp. BSR1-1 TaxID=3020845 RepID=UPI0025AEF615|nr:ribose ABC transporter permease [Paenibacillus sp. BSR1-1]MDN3019419.1 ribose ABC transporter permease [Paenibacillus sp. BSR1-1]